MSEKALWDLGCMVTNKNVVQVVKDIKHDGSYVLGALEDDVFTTKPVYQATKNSDPIMRIRNEFFERIITGTAKRLGLETVRTYEGSDYYVSLRTDDPKRMSEAIVSYKKFPEIVLHLEGVMDTCLKALVEDNGMSPEKARDHMLKSVEKTWVKAYSSVISQFSETACGMQGVKR